MEVNAFLRDRDAYYGYTLSEIDQEIRTNERLLEARESQS